MNILLIGNLISGIGCLLMVAIGLLRKKSHILIAQSLQCGFMGLGNLVLGGTSGFIANLVSIIRNLVFVKYEATRSLRLAFVALQLLLSLGYLGGGLVCWLPILAAGIFTWFLDTKSETVLKIVILSTQCLWLIYDIYYRNYIASAFDIMAILSNGVNLILMLKAKRA